MLSPALLSNTEKCSHQNEIKWSEREIIVGFFGMENELAVTVVLCFVIYLLVVIRIHNDMNLSVQQQLCVLSQSTTTQTLMDSGAQWATILCTVRERAREREREPTCLQCLILYKSCHFFTIEPNSFVAIIFVSRFFLLLSFYVCVGNRSWSRWWTHSI